MPRYRTANVSSKQLSPQNGGIGNPTSRDLGFPHAPKSHPFDSIARAACESAQVPYKGILDCGTGIALVLFDCPIHRTTMAVPLPTVSPEVIKSHLAECSFGHT